MRLKNLVLTILLLTSSSAFADWIGGRNTLLQASRPPVVININGSYSNYSRINLSADLSIQNQLRGYPIGTVTVIATSNSNLGGLAKATLMLNGLRPLDGDRVITPQGRAVTFNVDPRTNVFGQSLYAIDLDIAGENVFVQQVIFSFIDVGPVNPFPQPIYGTGEVVRQEMDTHIRSRLQLDYITELNLGPDRRGQAVQSVSVVASKGRGTAQGQLFINGQAYSAIQYFDQPSTRLTFFLPPGMKLGEQIQDLDVLVTGEMTIEEVAVDLAAYTHPSGENRFESSLNQRVYDNRGILLTDLIQIPSRLDDRIVDSVVLVLNNSDTGGKLKLCKAAQSATPSGDCGASVRAGNGNQILTLSGANLARVRETSLFITGMIDVQSVIINMK